MFSITSILIYYGSQLDIRVKSYRHFIFLRASVFNFEHLDILRDTIGHPSQKLLSFEFAQSFCFQLRASRYTTGHNRTSESKVIVVLNLLKASVLNYERLDILRDSIGHSSKKLLSFEFATSFRFEFGVSQYISGLNRTPVYKVIVVSISLELRFKILSISIYYGTQSDI